MEAVVADHHLPQRASMIAVVLVALVAVVPPTLGQGTPGHQMAAPRHGHEEAPVSGPARTDVHGPVAHLSRAPSAVFDRSGRLWIAWAEGRHVFVSASDDLGRTFRRAACLDPDPEDIDANSESRPKIATGPQGDIYVTYTRLGAKPYTGDVRFSRSVDGGRSFSPPVTVNDDGLDTGHRFDTLAVGADGTVFVAWIDKRDLEAAAIRRQVYEGAALYYAISHDRGRTFAPNRKLKDHVCECCRLATAFDISDRLVLVWRDILAGGIRDHALTWVDRDGTHGPVTRATRDGWAIDACPHHGPSLAIAHDGTRHVAWFTGAGPDGPGSFLASSTDQAGPLARSHRLGPAEPQGHASVLARGSRVYVTWKQPEQPGGTSVVVQHSDDDGATWTSPRRMASAEGTTDHPFLVASDTGVFLSWFTAAGGYRLIPLESDSGAPAARH